MSKSTYRQFRNNLLSNKKVCTFNDAKNQILDFRIYVSTNINNILATDNSLDESDFTHLKRVSGIERIQIAKLIDRLIKYFQLEWAIISRERRFEIQRILSSDRIIDIDKRYLNELFWINRFSEEKQTLILSNSEIQKIYSEILTPRLQKYSKKILNKEVLSFIHNEDKDIFEIQMLIDAIIENADSSWQWMYYNALCSKVSNYVLKIDRTKTDIWKAKYQKRMVLHYKAMKEELTEEFLPEQSEKTIILQWKVDIYKRRLLNTANILKELKILGSFLKNKDNLAVIKRFTETSRKLIARHNLVIDAIWDNIYYDIKTWKLDIKILDTWCFELDRAKPWDITDLNIQKVLVFLEAIENHIKELT